MVCRVTRAHRPREGAVGCRGRRRRSRRRVVRCPASPRSSAPCSPRAPRRMSSCRPPARCRAISTSCGACAIRSGTTSSTPTRAWATRSPAVSGSSAGCSPTATTAMSSSWSATAPTSCSTRELVTAVAEGLKVIFILIQNHGYRLDRAPLRDGRVGALRHHVPRVRHGARNFQGERGAARSTSR